VNHKELQPIEAYEPPEVHYASIVPAVRPSNDEPHQPVIYAELAATQPPVVHADDNA